MDGELLSGIDLWNAGEYLRAEEEFEHLWLTEAGARRRCLRGLVHAAMGFHYMTVRDVPSARSKLSSAASILAGFASHVLGLDLDALRTGIAGARVALEAAGQDGSFDPAGVPVPRLVSGAAVAAPQEAQA
ncbi:MAG TPA: DUF309 domain-containing protein [Candidatus Methylomirabilis sp.]|nr:DUF309 domain-containing protein [Candidatus Methylomirabilis sp.]